MGIIAPHTSGARRPAGSGASVWAAGLLALAACSAGEEASRPFPEPPGPGSSSGTSGTGGGAVGATGGSSASGGGGAGGADAGAGRGAAGATGGGAAGAGAAASAPFAVEASFETVRQVVSQAHCSDASCHNGEVKPRLYDDDSLYPTLTTHVSEACGHLPLVTPGDPAQSALVKIIKGPCGELPRMPNGCVSQPLEEYTCLPPDYIDAIERWVAAGAPL